MMIFYLSILHYTLTAFLAWICPHHLRGLSLLPRVCDGHVMLSVPQFAKDSTQIKFANRFWFKQQFCDCPMSIKAFSIVCKEGGNAAGHHMISTSNWWPRTQEWREPAHCAQWQLFSGFALALWNALSATAPQVQKYSSPIHKAHCL